MIALYSDGSLASVTDATDAAGRQTPGVILDGLFGDDETTPVPVRLLMQLDAERGPATSHTDRNATVDVLMSYLPVRS